MELYTDDLFWDMFRTAINSPAPYYGCVVMPSVRRAREFCKTIRGIISAEDPECKVSYSSVVYAEESKRTIRFENGSKIEVVSTSERALSKRYHRILFSSDIVTRETLDTIYDLASHLLIVSDFGEFENDTPISLLL